MARFIQSAIVIVFFVACALAQSCTPASNTNDNYFTCTNVLALSDPTSAGLSGGPLTNPVVVYSFVGQNCAGSPASIGIATNFTCINPTLSQEDSYSCSPDGTTGYVFSNSNLNVACPTTSGSSVYATGYCYNFGSSSEVVLCPGDLSVACSAASHSFRDPFSLACVAQTIYTDPIVTISGPTSPDVDVAIPNYRSCDIYANDEEIVRTGFEVISGGSQLCCRHRGVISGGVCDQGTCNSYTRNSNYFYQYAASSADGQYCYNDCNGYGTPNVTEEIAVHFNGAAYNGAATAYTDVVFPSERSAFVLVPNNGYNSTHEVAYEITVGTGSSAVEYGCRYKGSVSGSTCQVTSGCGGSIVTSYASYFYDASVCYADCYSPGEQYAYPIAASAPGFNRRRNQPASPHFVNNLLKKL